jgi:hypothetical protein
MAGVSISQSSGRKRFQERIGEAVIEITDDAVYVIAPYSKVFINAIKNSSRTRRWDALKKAWIVDKSELDLVRNLVKKFFNMTVYRSFAGINLLEGEDSIDVPNFTTITSIAPDTAEPSLVHEGLVCRYTGLTRFEKEVIKKRAIEVMNAVEKDMERGERIYVFEVFGTNTLFVKYYHRDYEYLRGWCPDPTQPCLFAILKSLRNRRGSRKHPYLYGYLAIVSRADPKLMLKRLEENPDRVIELPATPEMYEIVDKAFKEADKNDMRFEDLVNYIKTSLSAIKKPQ